MEFTCPRCAQTVDTAFYGPCDRCRDELRAKFVRVERTVEIAEYDVTPDGQHFVIRTKEKDTLPPIQLLFNAPRP